MILIKVVIYGKYNIKAVVDLKSYIFINFRVNILKIYPLSPF